MNRLRLLASGLALGALACTSTPAGTLLPSPEDSTGAGESAAAQAGSRAAASAGDLFFLDTELHAHSYRGSTPPAISIPAEHWLNTKRAPTLADLRGKVVWLEFSFST